MTEHAVIAVLVALLVSAVGSLTMAIYEAFRYINLTVRAMQIAETALDVAVRYGADAGPVEAVRRRLRDLQWEVGIEDAAGVPPVHKGVAEHNEEG